MHKELYVKCQMEGENENEKRNQGAESYCRDRTYRTSPLLAGEGWQLKGGGGFRWLSWPT